jgi:hypothetical protein
MDNHTGFIGPPSPTSPTVPFRPFCCGRVVVVGYGKQCQRVQVLFWSGRYLIDGYIRPNSSKCSTSMVDQCGSSPHQALDCRRCCGQGVRCSQMAKPRFAGNILLFLLYGNRGSFQLILKLFVGRKRMFSAFGIRREKSVYLKIGLAWDSVLTKTGQLTTENENFPYSFKL